MVLTDNLYRSGLPDEAVKVAYDGMQGALAYWIRQQQIVAEESLSARPPFTNPAVFSSSSCITRTELGQVNVVVLRDRSRL